MHIVLLIGVLRCTCNPATWLQLVSINKLQTTKVRALQGPEKTDFKFFEVLFVTEWVCTYDKLNIYAKKKKKFVSYAF